MSILIKNCHDCYRLKKGFSIGTTGTHRHTLIKPDEKTRRKDSLYAFKNSFVDIQKINSSVYLFLCLIFYVDETFDGESFVLYNQSTQSKLDSCWHIEWTKKKKKTESIFCFMSTIIGLKVFLWYNFRNK